MGATRGAASTVAAGGRMVDTVPGEAESPIIQTSWQRCREVGLDARARPDFDPLAPRRLTEMRDLSRALCTRALPVMESLYEQIYDTESMLVLTDASGLILHSMGDDAFLQRAERVALRPGVTWTEDARGTNAIGTAIVERRATRVHGAEHFLAVNHFLTCSAVPIFAPDTGLIGVLDVTSDKRRYDRHTLALVRMSASLIENDLFKGSYPDAVTLHFHARAELIGTLFEGIAVFRPDGSFIAANKSAVFQFGATPEALQAQCFAALFGTPLPAVLGRARNDQGGLQTLTLTSGVRVHARVSCGSAITDRRVWTPGNGSQPDTMAARVAPVPGRDTAAGGDAARHERALPAGTPRHRGLSALDTGDPQLKNAIERIRRVLGHEIPILIHGETGTGKELLARAVHDDSPRASGPFVAVNCASIPEGLIESELFGYEDGAFTGARKRGHTGKILLAHGGTLFLDEVGDMPLNLQARLLRVLQERVVVPLGSVRAQPVDIALVCATHRRLKDAIVAGRFREDLYYRLLGLQVTLPPLRQRGDLESIVRNRLLCDLCGRPEVEIDPAVIDLFRHHPWPGNLRQLASVMRTALAMLGDETRLRIEHLPEDFLDDIAELRTGGDAPTAPERAPAPAASTPAPSRADVPARPAAAAPALPASGATLHDLEIAAIERALAEHGGNVSAAARALGVSRNTIYRKCGMRQGLNA